MVELFDTSVCTSVNRITYAKRTIQMGVILVSMVARAGFWMTMVRGVVLEVSSLRWKGELTDNTEASHDYTSSVV